MNSMRQRLDRALEDLHVSPFLAERIAAEIPSEKRRRLRPLIVLAAAAAAVSVGAMAAGGRLWNVERLTYSEAQREADRSALEQHLNAHPEYAYGEEHRKLVESRSGEGVRITQEQTAYPLSYGVRERLHGLLPHYAEQWLAEFNGLDRDAFATQEAYEAALKAIDEKWAPLLSRDSNVLPDALHYETLTALRDDLGIDLLPFERLGGNELTNNVTVSLIELNDQTWDFNVYGSFFFSGKGREDVSLKVIYDLYTFGGQQYDSRSYVEGSYTKTYPVESLQTDALLTINDARQSVSADLIVDGIAYRVDLQITDEAMGMTERIDLLTSLLERLG